MAYDPTAYAKYLKNKISHGGCSGCDDCADCGGSSGCDEECSCCPAGLVAVYDSNGKHAGCLTPTDATEYTDTMPCAPGFVKLYKSGVTPQFLGCVGQDEFAALYASVNPTD